MCVFGPWLMYYTTEDKMRVGPLELMNWSRDNDLKRVDLNLSLSKAKSKQNQFSFFCESKHIVQSKFIDLSEYASFII